MKFLKNLALGLLGLILSLSLTVFGLAFTVKSTALNPGFITREINELDISTLVGQLVNQPPENGLQNPGEGPPKELIAALTKTATELQPLLKERINAAINSIYDYLFGKRPNPDLAVTLRSSILKKDFFIAVVDKVDISSFAKDFLRQQIGADQVPPELRQYLDSSLDKVVSDLKPWMKEQINIAADPVLDYLVGQRASFSIVISLDPLKTKLKETVRAEVLRSPPPLLATLPPAQLEAIFNGVYDSFAARIPSTQEINQSLLDPKMKENITQGLSQAEEKLVQAREIIKLFQLYYNLLIALILVSIAGIILIYREVRGAARSLGAIFLSYGVFEYAGVLIGQYFANKQLPLSLANIPPSLQTWVTQLSNRLFSPLGTFSLVVLIAGAVLLVVSFVYPKRQAKA